MSHSFTSIDCIRQIILKSVITEAFKQDIIAEIQKQLTVTKQQYQQLRQLLKEPEKMHPSLSRKELKSEIKKATIQIALLENKLAEAKNLKNGQKYVTGSIQGISPLCPGDDIREKLDTIEVLSKDYIVQSIVALRHKSQVNLN